VPQLEASPWSLLVDQLLLGRSPRLAAWFDVG
jgi:hypothetical protein